MKIAILVPHYGDVKGKTAECLANLTAATKGHEIRTFSEAGLLPMNRNKLAVKALHWEADLVLWVDADMTFPEDALQRLVARNVAIVGANYLRRGDPRPTAGKGSPIATPIQTTQEAAEAGRIEEVDQMGLGFCLMEASALRELQTQAVKEGLPLFHFELMPSGTYLGEDNFFFARAQRLGFKIHVDQAVSWGVGHIGEQVSTFSGGTNADSVHAPTGPQ